MSRGSLVVFVGPMFAGKSAHLIAEAKAHAGTLRLTPVFDTRSGGCLHSREGVSLTARAIASWPADATEYAHVVVDEAQFLGAPFYEGDIVADILDARAQGVHLAVGSLDTDYRREPFGITQRLISAADCCVRLQARCHVCGAPARWTAKKRDTGCVLETGDDELYEARCDAHWSLPGDVSAAGGADLCVAAMPEKSRPEKSAPEKP
ncbi:thymidine kinase [Brytella acorum]|uniref:Thymidine kinase n=1 Tax=Brytella acorum TaxID=2959299 RepID=A0AA35UH21_9PROT|nr:thymidine kinase [Brytella acorum]MDF3623693.1 thymidine kinase [Brytella acorum]CAI9119889.1 thymidine kinase [Brytella acorum]